MTKLYQDEGKTLQDIGDLFGVSRERVRQVMARFGIPRSSFRTHKNRYQSERCDGLQFQTLDEYLQYNATHSKVLTTRTVRKYLPDRIQCAECHLMAENKGLNVHHIVYPATTTSDIQILCNSCHKIRHNGKMTFAKQISIHRRYCLGEPARALAASYAVSLTTIYMVIRKIGNNNPSLCTGLAK